MTDQLVKRRRFAIPNPGPTILLAAFFCLGHLENDLGTLRGAPPEALFSLLYYIGVALVIATWIRADRHHFGLASTFDDGFFIFVAWPLALSYHLFTSRGWRGGLTLLGFVALNLLSYALTLPIFLGLRYWLGDLR
jgi:hypothetical protein